MSDEEKKMDSETKETLSAIFDSIATETKVRRRTSTPYPSKTMDKWGVSADREGSHRVTTHKESSGSFEQAKIINTRSETATLSLNTSKACIVFRAVLSDEVILSIKETIPSKLRFWNERDKVWEFNPICIKELKSLLSILYDNVQVIGVPKTLPSTKFDKLIAKLDKDDKTKIYRLLAARYHPDIKGSGSHEVMSLINEVFKQ